LQVEYVRQFFDETACQLCGGFAVNTGRFSVRLRRGRYAPLQSLARRFLRQL
jgi:hypothetical protein